MKKEKYLFEGSLRRRREDDDLRGSKRMFENKINKIQEAKNFLREKNALKKSFLRIESFEKMIIWSKTPNRTTNWTEQNKFFIPRNFFFPRRLVNSQEKKFGEFVWKLRKIEIKNVLCLLQRIKFLGILRSFLTKISRYIMYPAHNLFLKHVSNIFGEVEIFFL